jgi:hypothetical protein
MTIKDLRQECKEETGNYPFGSDLFGQVYSLDHAKTKKGKLVNYINWLENKVIELKTKNYESTKPAN